MTQLHLECAPLPISGKVVVLRQLTGEDEMAAADEAGGTGDTPSNRIAFDHALVQRSIVSIDGEPFDRSKVIGPAIRNLFDPRDWQLLLMKFRDLHIPEVADAQTFRVGGKFISR